MEKEKLIVRNFGPIKEIDLDLGRFNILIGEQATGKSTVAKVLAVCRDFRYIFSRSIGSVDTFRVGLYEWGLEGAIQADSYIYYKCKDYEFSAQHKEIGTIVSINGDKLAHTLFAIRLNNVSNEFNNLLNEANKILEDNSSLPRTFFRDDVSKVIESPFYFPTERGLQSVFELGQKSIPRLGSFLYDYFVDVDEIIRSFQGEVNIEPLSLVYEYRIGGGFIRKSNAQNFFSLRVSASGYQSTTPVILVIKYFNEIRGKSKTFIIEEPELNLFPNAQNKLMQYIADMGNKHGNSVLLTTHSPYILTAINNMMYAYQTAKIDSEKTSAIIEEKFWLNSDDVSAYLLRYDETAGGIIQENIIDDEVKQIKAEKIDEISRQFNKEYDEMLDIKYPAK